MTLSRPPSGVSRPPSGISRPTSGVSQAGSTLGRRPSGNCSKANQSLRRYLDLMLTGTKKSLSVHGQIQNNGRKDHPPSPYTFDRPEMEQSVTRILKSGSEQLRRTPLWFKEINDNHTTHTGEAPMFAEYFLPKRKHEQTSAQSRPLSGISTKSAPVIINGDLYYRAGKTHDFLQASNRPCSAQEGRLTRASKLRNKRREECMSAVPSNDTSTKLELKRMKEQKPKPIHMNKDLLPIPSNANESPHSFIVGARYNCSHFMDSRSFNRLGLYVPRNNPLATFLKTCKTEEQLQPPATAEPDFTGNTSVRHGGSRELHTSTRPLSATHRYHQQHSLPPPHVRKVVKEAWLNDDRPRPPPPQRVNPTPTSDSSSLHKESKQKHNTPRSSKGGSRKSGSAGSKVSGGSGGNTVLANKTNVQQQQQRNREPAPTKKRSVSAVIPFGS